MTNSNIPQKEETTDAQPIYVRDRFFYHVVVVALGTTIILSIIGGVLLVVLGKEVPEVVIGIGSAAVGALATAVPTF